jgi:hypothetical protein
MRFCNVIYYSRVGWLLFLLLHLFAPRESWCIVMQVFSDVGHSSIVSIACMCECVCVCLCVLACVVCGCVHTCVRACVRACVSVLVCEESCLARSELDTLTSPLACGSNCQTWPARLPQDRMQADPRVCIPQPRRLERLEVLWVGQRGWDLVLYLRRVSADVREPSTVFVCTLQWWYQPASGWYGSAWEVEGISRLYTHRPPQ